MVGYLKICLAVSSACAFGQATGQRPKAMMQAHLSKNKSKLDRLNSYVESRPVSMERQGCKSKKKPMAGTWDASVSSKIEDQIECSEIAWSEVGIAGPDSFLP